MSGGVKVARLGRLEAGPVLALAGLAMLSAAPVRAACPGMTQIEMNECAAAAYGMADAELNAVWPAAMASMRASGAHEALRDAQRKWIAFRDAACAAEAAQYAGGSIAPLVYSDCLTRLTQRRTDDLRALVN